MSSVWLSNETEITEADWELLNRFTKSLSLTRRMNISPFQVS